MRDVSSEARRNNRSSTNNASRTHYGRGVALKIPPGVAILSNMFTDAVLDHFRNPRNAGELPGADAEVEVSNPVCGDILQLSVRMEGERIAEVRFLCRGCTTAIACASLLTEELRGRTPTQASEITAESLSQSLEGLPPATFHGAQLAVDAANALLQELLSANR